MSQVGLAMSNQLWREESLALAEPWEQGEGTGPAAARGWPAGRDCPNLFPRLFEPVQEQ